METRSSRQNSLINWTAPHQRCYNRLPPQLRSNDAMKASKFVVGLTTVAVLATLSLQIAAAASQEPENSKPQQVFDGMRGSFKADKAKGVHAKWQWQLSGPDGGEWWIEVNDGT